MSDQITWEEYKADKSNQPFISNMYSPTNIKCPKCGQPVYRRNDIVLTCYPAKYRYECLKCDWADSWY